MKGGAKVVVEQHRHAGVFIARGKEDALVTRNMVPGESVYGEKRISVEQVRARGAGPCWPAAAAAAAAAAAGCCWCVPRQPGRAGPGVASGSAAPSRRPRRWQPACPSLTQRHLHPPTRAQEGGDKIEYRVWNPFRSKLAAAVLAGVDNIHIKPGAKVLYLGGASGTSVSHVSDIVGPEGTVYAVEFSHRRCAWLEP